MIKTKFSYKRQEFSVLVENSVFNKFSGLMFRSSGTRPLLFSFKKPKKVALHSFFVFFDFLILWLDGKNRVIDYKIIKPFTGFISSEKKCSKILEIPRNNDNIRLINFFVGNKKI